MSEIAAQEAHPVSPDIDDLPKGTPRIMARLYRTQRGNARWWTDTLISVRDPLPVSFDRLVAAGLIEASNRGKIPPLGLAATEWIIRLTERGIVMARLHGWE